MQMNNLGLFLLQAVIYFIVMGGLLHFRHRIGIGVFIAALGVMHFMETYLAAIFYVSLPFGTVSPGSSVFFAGKLMMILLLYMKEDAATVRQPIYGLFIGNLLTVLLAQILQLHVTVEIAPGRTADFAFLQEMGWLMIWGTMLLYLDAIGIILLYERLGRFMQKRIVLRFAISGAVILTFDQIGFYTALHYLVSAPVEVFWGGWKAKMLVAVIYALLFGAYQYMTRGVRASAGGPQRPIADIFNDLTFRERYEDLLARFGRDILTGVYDRSRMEIEAPKIFRSGGNPRKAASLMIIDADFFKEINDQFGHLRGDEVLKQLAITLQAELRPSIDVFRFGGEEFVALMPGTDHDAAVVLAEKLRRRVALDIRRPDGRPVTVSIGVASMPEDGDNFSDVLAEADNRLYQAKKNGRDCVHGRLGKFLPVTA